MLSEIYSRNQAEIKKLSCVYKNIEIPAVFALSSYYDELDMSNSTKEEFFFSIKTIFSILGISEICPKQGDNCTFIDYNLHRIYDEKYESFMTIDAVKYINQHCLSDNNPEIDSLLKFFSEFIEKNYKTHSLNASN
jgi:hypothetical protein